MKIINLVKCLATLSLTFLWRWPSVLSVILHWDCLYILGLVNSNPTIRQGTTFETREGMEVLERKTDWLHCTWDEHVWNLIEYTVTVEIFILSFRRSTKTKQENEDMIWHVLKCYALTSPMHCWLLCCWKLPKNPSLRSIVSPPSFTIYLWSRNIRSDEKFPDSVQQPLKHSWLLPPLQLADHLLHPLVHPHHQVKLPLVLLVPRNLPLSPPSKRSSSKSRRHHPTQSSYGLKWIDCFSFFYF